MSLNLEYASCVRRRLCRCSSMVGVCLWLAVVAFNSGCASVKPWEKDTLSEYSMRPDRDPLADMLYEHVYFTREAATGGRGVGGGGCGCN